MKGLYFGGSCRVLHRVALAVAKIAPKTNVCCLIRELQAKKYLNAQYNKCEEVDEVCKLAIPWCSQTQKARQRIWQNLKMKNWKGVVGKRSVVEKVESFVEFHYIGALEATLSTTA